jgi:hypothetical protein
MDGGKDVILSSDMQYKYPDDYKIYKDISEMLVECYLEENDAFLERNRE